MGPVSVPPKSHPASQQYFKGDGSMGVAQGGRGSRPAGEPGVGETGLENPAQGQGRIQRPWLGWVAGGARVGHSNGLRSRPYRETHSVLLSPKPQNQSLGRFNPTRSNPEGEPGNDITKSRACCQWDRTESNVERGPTKEDIVQAPPHPPSFSPKREAIRNQ